jgi:hypothetical protein
MARTEGQWKRYGSFISPTDGVPLVLDNSYINFGGLISGDIGFGIRNNNGVIQIKNENGTWAAPGGGSSVTTFETINKNLLSYNVTATTESATLITQTYNGPNGDIIKSISFDSSGLPTTIVLSGDTPAGINLTKTFDFSSQEIPLITYS